VKALLFLLLFIEANTLPVQAQVRIRPTFTTPDGEKKVGDYVWVWHTERIAERHEEAVEADCPVGYAVTGGGYRDTANDVLYGMPNPGFDGWIVEAAARYSEPNTVTVYAGCAPGK
jgi:hypothetical protein